MSIEKNRLLMVEQIKRLKGQLNEAESDVVKDVKSKLKELGYGKFASKVPADISGSGWHLIGKQKLNPKEWGLFAPAFKSVEVEVKVGLYDDKDAVIRLQFRWEHPTGRNGLTVDIVQRDGKWQEPYS